MNNRELAASQIHQAIANLRRERTPEAERIIGELMPITSKIDKLTPSFKDVTIRVVGTTGQTLTERLYWHSTKHHRRNMPTNTLKIVESGLGHLCGKEARILNLSSKTLELAADYPSGVHFILVYDRSGSMSRSLPELIEHVKKAARQLRPGDYLSTFWYSGSNQHGCITKFARITGSESDFVMLDKLLDKYSGSVGCTVFSQVLAEIKELVDETADISTGIAISFFTDGQLVPDHQSSSAERAETLALSAAICANPKFLALDTVGYGPYYDRDLLAAMSACSKFGTSSHSSKIAEYFDIFSKTIETVKATVPSELAVSISGPGVEVFYLSDNSMFHATKSFLLSALSKKDNKLIILYPKDSAGQVVICGAEDEVLHISGSLDVEPVQQANVKTVTKVFYGLGAKLYQMGRREDALDIFTSTVKDGTIVKKIMRSFSVPEVGATCELLEKAYTKPKHRNPDTLDPKDSSDSSANLLRLMEHLETYETAHLDMRRIREGYRRVGLKNAEHLTMFVEDYDVPLLVPIYSISFHAERLNLYVNTGFPGEVHLPTKLAESVKLPNVIRVVRFKTYNLVVDGNFNVSQLPIVFVEDTENPGLAEKEYKAFIAFLLAQGFNGLGVELNNIEHSVSVPTAELPLADRAFSKRFDKFNDGTDNSLAQRTVRETTLEIRQAALAVLLKHFEGQAKTILKSDFQSQYNKAQVDVLIQCGVNANGFYNPDQIKNDTRFADFVMSRNITFSVKGLGTPSKLTEAIAKKTANKLKPGTSFAVMYDAFEALVKEYPYIVKGDEFAPSITPTHMNLLRKEAKRIKRALAAERTVLGIARFVKGVTGGWFSDLPLQEGASRYELSVGKTSLSDDTQVAVTTSYRKLVVNSDFKKTEAE
jgi:hypothetical protein